MCSLTVYTSYIYGILTLGVCYGFQIMRVTESPNTAFTILYTRFLEGKLKSLFAAFHSGSFVAIPAPQVAIYDNGCNLHNYCLNREPLFFQRTWFMIDRLHSPNHVGKLDIDRCLCTCNNLQPYVYRLQYRISDVPVSTVEGVE